MNPRPSVFFWQNMPAHHQVGALDRLAATWGAPVTGVWMQDVLVGRAGHGWVAPPRRALAEVFLPATGWEEPVDQLTAMNAGAIHLFSGIGAYSPVTRAAKAILRQDEPKAGLIVETALKERWLHLPRWIKSFVTYFPRRDKLRAVYAIGLQGEAFYRGIGFSAEQIFPYIYQGEAPLASSPRTPGPVRVIFVGTLARYKGLDVLLSSLGSIKDLPWSLSVIGDGPDRSKLESLSVMLGLSDRVSFRGRVRSDKVVSLLAQHDLCVVPSRYDGWGMATSEALQAGIPAIVSTRAGSADLIIASGAGAVFDLDDVAQLVRLLRSRIEDSSILFREKMLAQKYAPSIAADVVGDYLKDSLEHVFLGRPERPSPPWLSGVPK